MPPRVRASTVSARRAPLVASVAAVVLCAGYADLAAGSLTVAPLLLVAGYLVLVPLALLAP
jgi:hypothetical protein